LPVKDSIAKSRAGAGHDDSCSLGYR
jgi:hypothetical protein